MPSKQDFDLYIPEDQTITLWFVREGMPDDKPELWVDIRADLTFNERKALQETTQNLTAEIEDRLRAENAKKPEEDQVDDQEIKRQAARELQVEAVWDAIAPYVLDWSVGERIDGKPVKIDPPAVAGGQQLALISESHVIRIINTLMVRSEGNVEVSFLDKSKRTPKPTGNGNAAVMKH